MSLVINTNVHSLQAQRRLQINSETLQKTMTRLSSGYRINKSADDAAGQFISQNLMSQVTRMRQAERNAQDGISVLQTAEGTLTVIGDNLQRVRELAVQAANDTYDANSRTAMNTEITALLNDIDRIARVANFNGVSLLDGTAANALLQIGPNSNAVTNVVDITSVLQDATSAGLGVVGGTQTFATVAAINLSTTALARSFMTDVEAALRNVNLQRARIGSMENKLGAVISNLNLSVENFSGANSRIRDLDIASESAKATQFQILTQAAASVLAQTNQLPQMILSLLQK